MRIAVINGSSKVSNDDAVTMTEAVASQLWYQAAPLWGRSPAWVTFYPDPAAVPVGAYVIGLADDSDQAGALGWHTEDSSQPAPVYGRVFASPVFDHGGDALHGNLSVASVLSHEVLEAYINPAVNRWADNGAGTEVAMEVGDPVENDSYPILHSITVSNFVGPGWFDPQAGPTTRFDWMRRLTGPFTMTSGGYIVTRAATGGEQQQYGEAYPEWRKATKADPLARTARLLR